MEINLFSLAVTETDYIFKGFMLIPIFVTMLANGRVDYLLH